MSFLDFLGLKKNEPDPESASIKKICDKLAHLDPGVARHHALFACILSRVAHVDQNISPEEAKSMEDILLKLGHLDKPMALLVSEIARLQNTLLGGIEDFMLTREFVKISSPEERRLLLQCLLAVAAADKSISAQESDTIALMAKELKIEHADFILARSRFREYLAVLK